MRRVTTLLTAALAALPAYAQVQAPRDEQAKEAAAVTATPSMAALELARLVSKSDAWQHWDMTLQRARGELLSATLFMVRAYKPMSCDPNDPPCLRAAEEAVERNLPGFIDAFRRERLAGYAARFDQRMSPDELRAATLFMRGSAGGKFSSVLLDSVLDVAIAARIRASTTPIEERTYDAFYEATKALPRRVLLAPPPPRMMPAKPGN